MKRLNLWQILVTAVVTGVVTVGTGMLLFNLQDRAPRLTYATTDTVPFSGGTAFVGIYNIAIANDGTKEVEDVVFVIQIPGATIKQYRLLGSAAVSKEEVVTADTYTAKLSGLNPSEEASISILAESKSEMVKRPDVTLRAKGVTGAEKLANRAVASDLISILAALVGALAGVMALASSSLKRRLFFLPQSLLNAASDDLHSGGDQREVFAYLCDLLGLADDVLYYRNLGREVSYWSESDRLTNAALASDSESRKIQIKDLLIKLHGYAAMASDSEAILHFNLARLSAALKQIPDRDNFLAIARRLSPGVLKQRLQLDSRSRELLSKESSAVG